MRVPALLVAFLVAATGTVRASGCGDESDATIPTPVGSFYVVVDECLPDVCGTTVWIYQESNGKPGAQRDDFCDAEGCCESDTIVF